MRLRGGRYFLHHQNNGTMSQIPAACVWPATAAAPPASAARAGVGIVKATMVTQATVTPRFSILVMAAN